MKICSSCHTLIADDATVCPNCGAEQRHFPKSKTKKQAPKRSHAAIKLILPAALLVALMAAILSFSLRESTEPAPDVSNTTEGETTLSRTPPDKIYVYNPDRWNSDVLDQQNFICLNGAGSYSYTYASGNLVLHGGGELSSLYEYQSYQNGKIVNGVASVPWRKYLPTVRSLRISGFDTISPELFKEMPELEYVELTPGDDSMLVGNSAFADCPSLNEVYTVCEPADAQTGEYASVVLGVECFSGCTALKEFNARGVSSILEGAFDGVSLQLFSVTERLKEIHSIPEAETVELRFTDPAASINRSVWETLLTVDEDPFVLIGNKVIFDYDSLPFADPSTVPDETVSPDAIPAPPVIIPVPSSDDK